MEKVLETIKAHQLIKTDEIIGVAVSGGRDSMALLHFLASVRHELQFELVAINIDHKIRQNSAKDSAFVLDYCKQNRIRAYKFDVDALKVAQEQKMSLEQAARDARYAIFESLISRGVADKIALGHHMNDQAETVLLNIFRGSGTVGAKGMDYVRDEKFIRPLLDVSRQEIQGYIDEHDIPYVEDETNKQNEYSRNFVRNVLMPLIKSRFASVEKNIINFSALVRQDDEYINSHVYMGAVIESKDFYKIPLSYFNFKPSIVTRMLLKILSNFEKKLTNIERKHITMIIAFAKEAENGAKICLPNGVKVYKEYDYITVTLDNNFKICANTSFKKGETIIEGYGKISVKGCVKMPNLKIGEFIVDESKIAKNAVWRFRKEGDMFVPFGNGRKKLNDYFTDKKIPLRIRDSIPVLADGSNILIVAGFQISDELKVTENTTKMLKISYFKDLI